MAAGSSSSHSACHKLTLKEFPTEFENVYLTREQGAGVTVPAAVPHDGRQRIPEEESTSLYPGIGLLRAEFNGGDAVVVGTASLIAERCLLTCVNLVVARLRSNR
jgi:hypothetical protein